MADAPIFVVGVARSGTTLLSAMLSAHSRLDCGPESRFFARYRHLGPAERRQVLDPATWPQPAVDFIGRLRNQGHPVVEFFGLTLAEVRDYLAERPPSVRAMLESLTALHARRAGKPRWVEKTPRHLLMTDTLRRLWPDAAIVRIVRDPRDVAVSLAGMPFAKESVVGNLVRIDQDERASDARIEADPRALTLRYEDLVTRPEQELRRVCESIGESFERAMLDARGTAGSVAAEHEWWKASVAGPLRASRVGRWRQEMAPEVQRFAALHLADTLRRRGYEGAREPAGEVALLPVADGVGPGNERLLLDLARHDLVVRRPAPADPGALGRERDLVFVGVRGQLDPSRGHRAGRRALTIGGLAFLLGVRRLRAHPALWVRQATLRERRHRDPGELLVATLLRVLARPVELGQVARLVAAGQGTRPADGRASTADDPPAAS